MSKYAINFTKETTDTKYDKVYRILNLVITNVFQNSVVHDDDYLNGYTVIIDDDSDGSEDAEDEINDILATVEDVFETSLECEEMCDGHEESGDEDCDEE